MVVIKQLHKEENVDPPKSATEGTSLKLNAKNQDWYFQKY